MDGVDEFTHHVAIKLSRTMNSLNPNDLLARRVIDIAKNNSADGFVKAAEGFGLTQVIFLKELHTEILDHVKQEKLGHHVAPVQGITVHDTDVLEPEPVRKGGLVRPDTVRILACDFT
jgi:pre-mRNA-splicing factor ATP-dependent RNA helicase DHX38/PRP16